MYISILPVKTNPSIEGYTQYVYSKPFSTIAQCPNLKYPANCAVMITGNLPGDTATYLCEEHFAQVEARTLICNKNGLWSDIPSMRRSVDGMKTENIHVSQLLSIPCNGPYANIRSAPHIHSLMCIYTYA